MDSNDDALLLEDLPQMAVINSNRNNNSTNNDFEFTGDPDHEINLSGQVYIEYDLEPGQLVFVDLDVTASILDEGNIESLAPAMFIEAEGPDNALFRVLNLDTE